MSASGQPALENAALDLDALRERSRRLLLSALDAVAAAGGGGGIRLVLDQRLSGPLGLVARPLDFRAHGVDKIYHLESGPPPQGAGPLVYFVRAEFESAQVIAAQLSCAEGSSARATLHFVPRRSLPCEKLLEEAGVYSRLAVRECHLHLLPLDKDLLSLERPCFRALYHDGDMSVLHSVASSILELEDLYGPVASLRGKGSCAQQVSRMLKQMRQPRQEVGRPAERGVRRSRY